MLNFKSFSVSINAVLACMKQYKTLSVDTRKLMNNHRIICDAFGSTVVLIASGLTEKVVKMFGLSVNLL